MGIHPWKDLSRGDLPEGNGRISLVGIHRTVMEGSLSWGSIRRGWKDFSRGDLSRQRGRISLKGMEGGSLACGILSKADGRVVGIGVESIC